MPSLQEKTVSFSSDHAQQNGSLTVRLFSMPDRIKRATLTLLVCWISAAIAIFIPLAHFILVPGFFIAGIVLTFKLYNQTESKESASGLCPHCQQRISIKMESNDTLPKRVYCTACEKPIDIADSTV